MSRADELRAGDPNEVVGHKTFDMGEICPETGFPKMRHEPITRAEAADIVEACERARKARAAQMPDEATALRVLSDAYERLTELGWRASMYAPRDGKHFKAIEAGSSGIHDCYRDPEGRFWVCDGDTWPSNPILFRLYPEDQAEEDARWASFRERAATLRALAQKEGA